MTTHRLSLPASPLPRRRPRIGYHGPIDARLDYELLDAMVLRRPEWQFVLAGPMEAGRPAHLIRRPNLMMQHRVRPDPRQAARLDVALFPFLRNEATLALNPPEIADMLALGVPVVSTPLPEIEARYAPRHHDQPLVTLVGDALAAIHAAERAMQPDAAPRRAEPDGWLAAVTLRSADPEAGTMALA